MDLFTVYDKMDDSGKLDYKFASDKYAIDKMYTAVARDIEQQILQLSAANFTQKEDFIIRHEQLKSNLHLMHSFIALNDTIHDHII